MLYKLMKLTFPRIFRGIFHCEVSGAERLPKDGGVIIAANHISNWDPPFVASFVPRSVHFMAKEELFKIPVFGQVIRRLGAFPVRRGTSDRAAIRTALQLLKNGACLGLFPEGTRSKNGALGKAEQGLALIALKAGVPVVPTAVVGTNRIFSGGSFFPKLKILYGKPLRINPERADKEAMLEFSKQIMDEIEKLLKEAAAG